MEVSLLVYFIVKHFVIDFLYQPEWMWRNKGNLRHFGGYAHATLHAVFTFWILMDFSVPVGLAVICSVAELIAHYIIDYGKMNLVKYKQWGANTHNQFWIALGADQMLHYLCYAAIIGVVL